MKREVKGGTIDLTWNNGPWANNGETVDATNSDNGTMQTIEWPDEATDPEELNADQKEVIRTAVRNSDYNSARELLNATSLENKHADYASNVLRKHWSEKLEEIRSKTNHTQSIAFTEEDAREIRTRLLKGESSRDVAKSFGASKKTVQYCAKGKETYSNYDEYKVNVPKLNYDTETGNWEINPETDSDMSVNRFDKNKENNYTTELKDEIPLPLNKPISDSTVDKLRKRALKNGETATGIASQLPGVWGSKVSRILRGDIEIEGSPNYFELEYDRSKGWKPVQGDEADESDENESENEPDSFNTDEEQPTWETQTTTDRTSAAGSKVKAVAVAVVSVLILFAYRKLRN